MNYLKCSVCGEKKEVPKCCDRSMILKDGLLCCCSSGNCSHRKIPSHCGQAMNYIEE